MSTSFIDSTYFIGDINIPFSDLSAESFQSEYVDIYVEEILVLILGRDTYNSMIASLEATPGQTDTEWTRLRDGYEYTITEGGVDYTVKWEGLKNSKLKSLLAYYVYVLFQTNNYQQNTALGVSIAKKENATGGDVRQLMINAYSKCAKLVGKYPNVDEDQDYILPADIDEELLKKFEPSLFNFMYYNKDDYPNWIFRHPDIYGFNMWDI